MYPNNAAHLQSVARLLAALKQGPIMIESSVSEPPQETIEVRAALLRASCEGKPCFSSCPRRQQKNNE